MTTVPAVLTVPAVPAVPARVSQRRLTKVEKEIREYTERNFETLIPASCMRRVVKGILCECDETFRMSKTAQVMLQAEAEAMMTLKFKRAKRIAGIANRETISRSDLKLVDELQN
jgi:histone H3/H4